MKPRPHSVPHWHLYRYPGETRPLTPIWPKNVQALPPQLLPLLFVLKKTVRWPPITRSLTSLEGDSRGLVPWPIFLRPDRSVRNADRIDATVRQNRSVRSSTVCRRSQICSAPGTPRPRSVNPPGAALFHYEIVVCFGRQRSGRGSGFETCQPGASRSIWGAFRARSRAENIVSQVLVFPQAVRALAAQPETRELVGLRSARSHPGSTEYSPGQQRSLAERAGPAAPYHTCFFQEGWVIPNWAIL